ncbi:MAG: TRAP transporter small permease subunit [Rhodospirillales bacterium]|nr:TRAP transporter small permease subunit [Rhodospirillales bacterium]
MSILLKLSGLIDQISIRIGRAVYWLVLLAVVVSATNAVFRYSLNMSSNAWLEVQWYLFSAVFLLCAPYTLQRNEHIRIDVVAGKLSKTAQTWIDIFGTVFFLLPMAYMIFKLSLPIAEDSFMSQEHSTDAGGLIRWPVKMLIPIGFFLLLLQGLSELIKRIGFLMGLAPDPLASHSAHGSNS